MLAVEEACKGYVFSLCAIGFPVGQKALNSKKHRERHKLVALMPFWRTKAEATVHDLSERLMTDQGTMQRLQNASLDESWDYLATEFGKLWTQLGTTEGEITALAAVENLIDEWWGKAEDVKQHGFYLDFVNGRWQSPESVDHPEYAATLERAQIAIREFSVVARGLSELPPDGLRFMRRIFDAYKTNAYERAGKAAARRFLDRLRFPKKPAS